MLKTTGVILAGGLLASGNVAAHGGEPADSGASVSIGDSTASTYTERTQGQLSAIGVRFGSSVLSGLPTALTGYHLSLPAGETGRFKFVGMDWNPGGHEPQFLYGHPHFDFHFYMQDEDAVAAIPGGSPTYDIPAALMPANTVTAADLAPPIGPAPREVVPGMGEHLVSMPASMPNSPGDDGWSVFIWGAYDPDSDGSGQLTFMEPMITVAYLLDIKGAGTSDAEETASIPMPERFLHGGWYPTEFVVRYHNHDDTFTVSLESFEQFAGYGRR